MSDLKNDNYIGIEEAAEYLGVKTSTIRTWIKKKKLCRANLLLLMTIRRSLYFVV